MLATQDSVMAALKKQMLASFLSSTKHLDFFFFLKKEKIKI